MIKAYFYRNAQNEIYGFKVCDHGDPIVCAAVSALAINAANSIESLTDEHIKYSYDKEGGYIEFELPNVKSGKHNSECALLLNSLLLGLLSVRKEHKKHITVIDDDIKGFEKFLREV